jgi:hypothetical protein
METIRHPTTKDNSHYPLVLTSLLWRFYVTTMAQTVEQYTKHITNGRGFVGFLVHLTERCFNCLCKQPSLKGHIISTIGYDNYDLTYYAL